MVDDFSSYFPEQSRLINGVERSLIEESLINLGLHKEAVNFGDCHTRFLTYPCSDCGYVHYLPLRCDLRICPDCGKSRHSGYVMTLNKKIVELANDVPKGYRLRMYTLTSPKISIDEWNGDFYSLIQRWHTKFRSHKFIKPGINGGVGGGIYNIETKYSEERGSYIKKRSSDPEYEYSITGLHIHIHGLMLSKYIDQSRKHEFSRAWRDVTGGVAYIADIREIDNTISAISEVTKYIYKPSILGNADNYAKFLVVTKGRRLNNTYGSFRKLDLKRSKKNISCSVCGGGLIKGEVLDRDNALIEFEAQDVPKSSLYSHFNKKPVSPVFVDK